MAYYASSLYAVFERLALQFEAKGIQQYFGVWKHHVDSERIRAAGVNSLARAVNKAIKEDNMERLFYLRMTLDIYKEEADVVSETLRKNILLLESHLKRLQNNLPSGPYGVGHDG